MDYRTYGVSVPDKKPLLNFIISGLQEGGCRVIKASPPNRAPFRITFEDPSGHRHGIIAYAFFANSKETKNRPSDEHRFQVKYGSDAHGYHEIWQDPFGLYTTLMVGIDPLRGVFVGIDPVLHELTKFFISVEFKRADVETIIDRGWHWWERERRSGDDSPIETVVGGRQERFLEYVRFEQAARGLDQGHRQLLAEKLDHLVPGARSTLPAASESIADIIDQVTTHELADEFELTESEILDLIQSAPRLKMAVRGWVAERHLQQVLEQAPGVDRCTPIEEDGRPDFEIVYRGSRPILVECKNVLRATLKDGTIRVDFQKTRSSKGDPCSRFYKPSDFEILAACLHPQSEKWEFNYRLTRDMEFHRKKCPEHLSNNVRLSDDWFNSPSLAFEQLLAS